MSRAKRNSQETCDRCDRPFYSKGLCKRCYMADYRGRPAEQIRAYNPVEDFDYEDFWLFVKKELNLG
ncbi:hypothetical protein UFOVP115_63 [uncultured Caudovirales phage]|uniref:Uncharacterized protein n=1 Tax=uncultured Caudovirales phage TaxID=2100421 RepID=A0A6J5L6E3_9CAUD|nr:hypothetical protein UFOVP115_63 [uncultured Caudovirales phage]